MGIVILAAAAGALVLAGLMTAATIWLNRRRAPASWGHPAAQQPGLHVGARCPFGNGQLQLIWQHGAGRILGCSNYPVCRTAYQFNGRPLPATQQEALLRVR